MIQLNNKKKRKGFSKKMLIADYIIAAVLVVAFFVCTIINGSYTMSTTNKLIEEGADASTITVSPPFDLGIFGIFLSTWIIQLGVSSGAYYMMAKSEHKIELPMELINDLPEDVKEQVDMTQIITSVLSSTNN
jgi:hypothetical protein